MTIEIDYLAIEEEVRAGGMSMSALLRRADLPHQTWTMWKKGVHEPNLGKLNQVLAEVEKL